MSNSNHQDQAKPPEMSMDEVLASIRKIIATDNESVDKGTGPTYQNPEIIELTDEVKAPEQSGTSEASPPFNISENVDEELLTQEAIKSSRESISALCKKLTPTTDKTTGSPTIEDLVIQALKPMLREWMSDNLPLIIEKVVQKEIQKLIQK